jgi:chitodextrinase
MKFATRLKQTASALSSTTLSVGAVVTLGAAATNCRTLAQAISDGAAASDTTAIQVNDTNVPFVFDDGTNWMEAYCTITSTTQITIGQIVSGSNGTNAVTFSGALPTVFNVIPGKWLRQVVISTDGVAPSGLSAAGTLSNTDTVLISQDGNNIVTTTLASIKTFVGAIVDTTAPTTPTGLASSGVTATAATLSWTASTDNSGATPTYEVSNNGSSWTAVSATTYNFTGLTASTLYTLQVRAIDGSGNKSAAASLQVTTSAASDTQAPVMSGSVTSSNITSSGLTMSYSAGTDNVGITRYDVSVDTGTANWIANGTNLSYNATGLSASTGYTLRVRAVDAAGNISNVLTASATTSAAGTPQYILTGPPANSASFNQGPTAMTTQSGADSYSSQSAAIYVKTAAGVAAPKPVKFAWGKSPTTPPLHYNDTALPIGVNGNTTGHTGNASGSSSGLGGWTTSADALYGLFSAGSAYAWGTPGTYYLWVLTSDGFEKAYDNNTGTAIGWVLT